MVRAGGGQGTARVVGDDKVRVGRRPAHAVGAVVAAVEVERAASSRLGGTVEIIEAHRGEGGAERIFELLRHGCRPDLDIIEGIVKLGEAPLGEAEQDRGRGGRKVHRRRPVFLQHRVDRADVGDAVGQQQGAAGQKVGVAAPQAVGMAEGKRHEFDVVLPHPGAAADILGEGQVVGVGDLNALRFAGGAGGIEDLGCFLKRREAQRLRQEGQVRRFAVCSGRAGGRGKQLLRNRSFRTASGKGLHGDLRGAGKAGRIARGPADVELCLRLFQDHARPLRSGAGLCGHKDGAQQIAGKIQDEIAGVLGAFHGDAVAFTRGKLPAEGKRRADSAHAELSPGAASGGAGRAQAVRLSKGPPPDDEGQRFFNR